MTTSTAKYPGVLSTGDGSSAVVAMETAASEAAGAYPITPSTQMGEGWAMAVAQGKKNVNDRNLIFFEAEGEHAAAGVTAGMSMVGMRSTNFSSSQGVAYMHESLYAAVGKRLTYILNVACRAITKHSLNVHAGHDDYHSIDDTGMFQVFAKDVQGSADLNLISHRIAELSLNPGVCAQDGFLTSHVIESYMEPERAMIKEYLGDPADIIDCPTPAQRLVYGDTRRRIPELYDFDNPALIGSVQNQESYAHGVAAQRPFYFDHIQELSDQAFAEFEALTGRQYARVSEYKMDDADYVLAGQGSVICNAQVVADYLREERGLKVGVMDMTMFRPFPSDRVAEALKGKKGVVVLERTDQPLAADLPMIREIRVAMAQAQENSRASGDDMPYPGIIALHEKDIPSFYSAPFGMGSRDLQPGDMVAAVENMLEGAAQQRRFYLGIDFINKHTQLPKQQIWQEQLEDAYPGIADLTLTSAGDINLYPEDVLSLRIHSVGGWGAITMGKNLAMTAADLAGLNIKANPKYGSEKKGQPTTFYASMSKHPLRLNCELKHVDVVLSPDPKVFLHSNPLEGLSNGGVFVIQSELSGEALWNSFPTSVQEEIRARNIKVSSLDGFSIALSEASDVELRFRMQGVAFLGAFFKASPLMANHGLDEDTAFAGIRDQLQKKFGGKGAHVVEDNVRVIRRGYDELLELDIENFADAGAERELPRIPAVMVNEHQQKEGLGNQERFWDQVCASYKTGTELIADPFSAMSAMPATTASMRDMTAVRSCVPKLDTEKCTGCGNCWTQCPDSAIPGVVNSVEEVLGAALKTVATKAQPLSRIKSLIKPLAKESHALIAEGPMESYAKVLEQAYSTVVGKMKWDAERCAEAKAEFAILHRAVAKFPLVKATPFFDSIEKKEKGAGGLLSVMINPETCKGCDLCVKVCADGALVTVQQSDEYVVELRENLELWRNLPETDDRFVKISNLEKGIGVLSSLLLKQSNYVSMSGGDGACTGCSEKTNIHLVLSAVNALMNPRVELHVSELDALISGLDAKARTLLGRGADLCEVAEHGDVDHHLAAEQRMEVARIVKLITELKDLQWRYTEGPSGKGRANLGFTNATGCTSVWGGSYPYNPYPFPWVNHLFQDSPSVAIGIFEGHMRKMADGFINVRRAALIMADKYDEERDEKFFANFEWEQFTDAEFELCPPMFAVGGDGAMMDIGFQNLSRLLATNKPIRVMVVDTQAYSNTGGQSCTSGFTGQVADMAEFGAAQEGKTETRKELALLGMAHRGVYITQTSQARPVHLLKSVLKGLQARRPALFIFNTPCPPEWGIPDDAAFDAAELCLESRAVPHLVFDPDAGDTFSERLDLSVNPSLDEKWGSRVVNYINDNGEEAKMTMPVTTADWALTEGRFRKHFRPADGSAELVHFADYLELGAQERAACQPFIYLINKDRTLSKVTMGESIVELADERQQYWSQLKEMAGVDACESLNERVAYGMEAEVEERMQALRNEYEAKIAELKVEFPRQLVERLVSNLLETPQAPASTSVTTSVTASVETSVVVPTAADEVDVIDMQDRIELVDDSMSIEPSIEGEMCTSCDDCINVNDKLFAYDDDNIAYIKDARGGTFEQLVEAAELCPGEAIKPGTPQNPKEKVSEELLVRAETFN